MNQPIEVNPFTTTVPKLENVTDKYKFISTQQFIEDVQSLGYKLETTTSPRRGLGMHSMEFSNPSIPQMDGLAMRLLATNSHDATSAFRLYVKVLVQVCSNGMVAWRAQDNFRVVHRGYALDKVASAVEGIHSRFEGTLNTIEMLKGIQVDAYAYAMEASKFRDAKPYSISEFIKPRHIEQSDNNAWNVFNRAQEALIKGGYRIEETMSHDGYGRINGRYAMLPTGTIVPGRKAKAITAIRESVAINTQLWKLTTDKYIG